MSISEQLIGPPVLCHPFIERLFCLPIVQICAELAALNSMNYIALFMSGCFLSEDEQVFASSCWFEVNQDMMSIKDPPEFLRCSCDIRNDDAVVFFPLSALDILYSFDKGPVWVATGFKCSSYVLLFLLLPLGLSGHILGPMV